MRTHAIFRSLLPFCLLPAAAGIQAADHVVTVGNGGITFNPQNLTIDAGDTVTFKQVNEPMAHNVHAADDSFRCSLGCRGDGSGATGDPTGQNWTATLQFDKAGVINYQCDAHANFGMVGSITVNAVAAAGQNITGGLSGNWFDPSPNQGGHGFQFEILPNNGMLAIWFVFDPAGDAQSWIYSQGTYDPNSNTTTLPAFLEQGGKFPPNFDSTNLTVTPWGSLKFTFTDCNNGSVDWVANDAATAAGYGNVSFPIQRLTSIAGTTCP